MIGLAATLIVIWGVFMLIVIGIHTLNVVVDWFMR